MAEYLGDDPRTVLAAMLTFSAKDSAAHTPKKTASGRAFLAETEGFEIAPMATETHWKWTNPRVVTWRMLD